MDVSLLIVAGENVRPRQHIELVLLRQRMKLAR